MADNIREFKTFVERKELQDVIERERKTLNELVKQEYEDNALLTSTTLLEQSQVIDELVLVQLRKDVEGETGEI